MAARQGMFGRMVLALPHSSLDYPAVEVVAELAECLGVQCVGTFIVEPAVASLGSRYGAQELRSIVEGWRPVEGESLAREIALAAESARQKFAAVVRKNATEGTFHLLQGGANQAFSSLVRRDDIVAMIEPRHPADRITHQFRNVIRTAFDVSSFVMLVPSRILRKQGTIAAVAASPNDPAIRVAADIAAQMKEALLIINTSGKPISRAVLPTDERRARIIDSTAKGRPLEASVPDDLTNAGERLIVARRTLLDVAGTRAVADRRGVPVLLTGGDD
jgi:hypothetical protein